MTLARRPDLSRLVMRRAARVGLVAVLLALGIGLMRIDEAIEEEVEAARHLAELSVRLLHLETLTDDGAIGALRALQDGHALRHLALRIVDGRGRVLLEPPAQRTAPGPVDLLARWHRRWSPSPPPPSVSWPLRRPDGRTWTLSLQPTPDGERREAVADFLGLFLVLLACIAGLLLVMRWNVRHSLAPLGHLLAAIDGIEHGQRAEVRHLPEMPTRELASIAAALRHLAEALEDAESRRRLLSQKMQTLQEDERARLARELHDEFGQRLTALRFDAAWLARQLADQPRLLEVVQSISQHGAAVQRDIRDLLVQLRPLGPMADGAGDTLSPLRLQALLEPLVRSWQQAPRDAADDRSDAATVFSLDIAIDADAPELPRDMVLALYRLSQEALTNAARHARARQVRLALHIGPAEVVWSVQDDGRGLGDAAAAMQRGNGLGGMQERVWALGGQWQVVEASPSVPGLHLQARLPLIPPAAAAPLP